jgi:hypothetical protein
MSELIKQLAEGLEFATTTLNATGGPHGQKLLSAEPGKVWTRLVSTDVNTDGTVSDRRYCWGFMDQDGNLWKSAGWKAPAKNKPRGTVADLLDAKKVENWRYGGIQ